MRPELKIIMDTSSQTDTWLNMSSPFQAPPAGTEVPPSSDARYFYRRQVYSRNPVTEGNWQAGKTVNFQAEASG